jgi:hypothetical protein
MTKPIERDRIYRCRRFSAETIELCVRWYITYRLEQPSPKDEFHGLRKLTSMAIKQPFEVWSRLVRKIPAGGK